MQRSAGTHLCSEYHVRGSTPSTLSTDTLYHVLHHPEVSKSLAQVSHSLLSVRNRGTFCTDVQVYSVCRICSFASQPTWSGKARDQQGLPVLNRREQRAALKLQTAWRRHRAQKEYQHYRSSVVTAQGLWRIKIARRKLRALRMEAREAGKLLQDKRFLETKVAELTSTLGLVQNQRNDTRQQFKVCPSGYA